MLKQRLVSELCWDQESERGCCKAEVTLVFLRRLIGIVAGIGVEHGRVEFLIEVN
jgi:hypothetical protein